MTAKFGRCIYCTASVDVTRGEGDHVVPAAFGRFHGEFVFRRICRRCNSRIGAAEEQLLRSAPEAFFRRLLKPAVKRGHRGQNWVGAKGSPPPKFAIRHGDHTELVDALADDPKSVVPVDQLVVFDQNGEHHIRLFPGMSAVQLRAKIDALGLASGYQSRLYADATVWASYTKLLGEVWPGSQVVSNGTTESGTHTVPGRTKFQFTIDYWRALAKIAFHYYLVHSQRNVRGDEAEFEGIRRFIIEGGDHEPFFAGESARFAMPFGQLPDGRTVLSSVWAHLLAADETGGIAVAAVHLFTGPQRLPPVHHVTLGRFRTSSIAPASRWCHAYMYSREMPSPDGYAGTVEPIGLIRLA